MGKGRFLVVCTTDSMIWNFLIPHIKALEDDGYEVECACSITGDFYENLRKKGLKMHKVDFARSPYNPQNIRAFFQLKKIMKKSSIDTVFCHEPVGGAMGRIVGHLMKCKVIYMAHGFHFYNGAPKVTILYYLIEKFLAKYTDILITINDEDYKTSLNFKAKKKYLLPGIGVDTSRFHYKPNPGYLRKELGLANDDFILLSVGELISRKNHEIVIDALNKLDNPKIHYVIVGEGELRQRLEEKISKLEQKNIYLLGYRKDINELCNSANVFIMPSLQEGLSVALMEAMACGMPVIASRIRGNIDLIPEEKYGFLIETDDIDGFSRAITELYNNHDKCLSMGIANSERIKIFDIESVKTKLHKIITQQL